MIVNITILYVDKQKYKPTKTTPRRADSHLNLIIYWTVGLHTKSNISWLVLR